MTRADIIAHSVVAVLFLLVVVVLAVLDQLTAPIIIGVGYSAIGLLTVADQRNYRNGNR